MERCRVDIRRPPDKILKSLMHLYREQNLCPKEHFNGIILSYLAVKLLFQFRFNDGSVVKIIVTL